MWRTLIFAPFCEWTHGCGRTAPKQRIADSPGLMIGVPASTPKTPTLVIVNDPPLISAGCVLPSRAVRVRPLIAAPSSGSDSASAPLMLGTTRPRGVAAAIPRLTPDLNTTSPAASSQVALISSVRRIARQTALATTSSGDTLTSRKSRCALSFSTSFIVLVTSTVIHSVTCGAVNAESTIACAIIFRTPLIGSRRSPDLSGVDVVGAT